MSTVPHQTGALGMHNMVRFETHAVSRYQLPGAVKNYLRGWHNGRMPIKGWV